MSTYLDEVASTKKYTPNVVVLIDGDYFAIREPDSGLSIDSPYSQCVVSVLLNPTQVDVRRVSTTISSFSFRLLDKDGIISQIVTGDAANVIGQEARIFLGRSNVDMDFADYFELPRTFINKCDHSDNSYNFSTTEQTERMSRPIYNFVSALGVDLLVGTTEWTMRDTINAFPTSGFLKVDDEFVSYAGVDLVNNRFTGVIRGELNSVPAEHDANTDCVLVETAVGNPLDIILQILISGGGGGSYDVLQDGLGIGESLIDIDEIEALRDELFSDIEYEVSLYDIPSALKYIEEQLLTPNNLRLTTSRQSKITLAILNKARFVEESDVIDEDTITKFPKWTLDGNKVTNVIEVNWDFNEGTGMYEGRSVYTDNDSIAEYDEQTPLKFSFKGIKSDLDGQAVVDDFGSTLLARLAFPTPEVSITTQIDKSLQNVGDKAYLVSSKIPAADGTLNFASDLEIISRAINVTNGEVQFKLAFTSFTNMRSGYIAPSDLIQVVNSQKSIDVPAGRGAYYTVGWKMRLFDEATRTYFSDDVNTIASISDDTITFEDDFVTTLQADDHRLRFADYDDVVDSQKRYCFISDDGANFDIDDKPTYKVTY